MEQKQEKEPFFVRNIGWILSGITLFALVTIIGALSVYRSNFSGGFSLNQETWASFGDFMGGTVGPILSFLALLALMSTIVLQSYELRCVREEMKLSRTAQENSEKALTEQAKILAKQLQETRRSATMVDYIRFVDILQGQSVRDSRRLIFQLTIDEKKPFNDWSDKQKATAEIACQSFDVVGVLIKEGLVHPDFFIKNWYQTIIKTWEGTWDLVQEHRDKDVEPFSGYEWLYKESKKIEDNMNPNKVDGTEIIETPQNSVHF